MEEQQALEVLVGSNAGYGGSGSYDYGGGGGASEGAQKPSLTSVQEIGCVLLHHVMHIITPSCDLQQVF